MPVVVFPDFLQELLHEMRTLGARSHHAHVPLQNVDELGQLIQARLAQEASESRPASIRLARPEGIAVGGRTRSHGAKFIHWKRQTIESYPLLDEENRPR